MSIEAIEEVILDCTKFMYLVECKRQKKYPYGPDIAFFYDKIF